MTRPLALGIFALSTFTFGGCFGETRLKEGAAAGAGIGALLGDGGGAGSRDSASPQEEPLRFFGPIE